MEQTTQPPGSILNVLTVVQAGEPEYSSWARDIVVRFTTDDGETKDEVISLSYSDWEGYYVSYEGDDDDLAEIVDDLTSEDMDDLERAALKLDGARRPSR